MLENDFERIKTKSSSSDWSLQRNAAAKCVAICFDHYAAQIHECCSCCQGGAVTWIWGRGMPKKGGEMVITAVLCTIINTQVTWTPHLLLPHRFIPLQWLLNCPFISGHKHWLYLTSKSGTTFVENTSFYWDKVLFVWHYLKKQKQNMMTEKTIIRCWPAALFHVTSCQDKVINNEVTTGNIACKS